MFEEDYEATFNKKIKPLIKRYEGFLKKDEVGFFEPYEFEQIIEYYLVRKQPKNAFSAANYAISQHPYSAICLFKKAQVLHENEQYSEALELMDKVEMMGGADSHYALFKSDVYVVLEQYDNAINCLLQAESLFAKEDKDQLYLELSDIYEACDKFEQAVLCLEKALYVFPANVEALSRITYLLDNHNLNSRAIKFFNKLINKDPYNYIAWNSLAYFYLKNEDITNAIEAYNYAIVIDEDDMRAYKGLGMACFEQGEYRDALRFFRTASKIQETSEITSLIGSCIECLGDTGKAAMYYKHAIVLDKNFDVPYFNLGLLYRRKGKYYLALNHILKAVELDADNITYLEELADAYSLIGNTENAINTHINIIKIDKKNKSNWLCLAIKYASINAIDLALETIDQSIDEIGSEAELLYVKSAYLILEGNRKEGIQILESALSKNYAIHRIIYEVVPGMAHDTDILELVEQFK